MERSLLNTTGRTLFFVGKHMSQVDVDVYYKYISSTSM